MVNQPKIADAIGAATAELHEIQQQLEQLRWLEQRAMQLEDFISLGQTLLGQAQNTTIPVQPPKKDFAHRKPPKTPRGKQTAPTCARELLEEQQKPMRLQEITRELLTRKWVKGKWAREVIRNALNRGDDFERLAPGVYAMKHWPDILKRWPPTESLPLYQNSTDAPSPNGSLPDSETESAYQREDHD
jgi:HB1, ASXL, restriction endonuclease HTH domain